MEALENNVKYDIRKGIILYLSDWFTPEKVAAVEEVLSRFLAMTGETFTKKRSGTLDAYPGRSCPSGFRNIRGGWQKIFHREFDGEFEGVLTLSNCDSEHVQTVHCFLALSNCKRWVTASSKIYFQFSRSVPWGDVWDFLIYVNQMLDIQYASAGCEMATNPFCFHPQAIRLLRDMPLVNSYDTEWFFRKYDCAIQCPNLIQVLSQELLSPLSPLPEDGRISALPMEGGKQLIHILDGEALEEPGEEELLERLHTLNTWFRPILFQQEKPMYFKPDAWEIRCQRFH